MRKRREKEAQGMESGNKKANEFSRNDYIIGTFVFFVFCCGPSRQKREKWPTK